jgi:hypothetical protein
MLVEKLNFTVNIDELRNYYETLQKEHNDRFWAARDNLDQIADGAKEGFKFYNGKDIDVAGWAVQRWNEGTDAVAPHPNILKGFNTNIYEQKIEDVQGTTPMIRGIAKRIIEMFPESSRMALSVVTAGTHLKQHCDENFLWRVHFPIYSKLGSIWETEEGSVHMEAGCAYLCDTRELHSVTNGSDENRVHLLFALPESSLEKLRAITGQF